VTLLYDDGTPAIQQSFGIRAEPLDDVLFDSGVIVTRGSTNEFGVGEAIIKFPYKYSGVKSLDGARLKLSIDDFPQASTIAVVKINPIKIKEIKIIGQKQGPTTSDYSENVAEQNSELPGEVKITTEGHVFQNSWSAIEITVDDASGQMKHFTLSTSDVEAFSGAFRTQGEEKAGEEASVLSSIENTARLSWKPPTISEEVKLGYIKRAFKVLAKSLAFGALNDTLKANAKIRWRFGGFGKTGTQFAKDIDKYHKLSKLGIQTLSADKLAKEMDKGNSENGSGIDKTKNIVDGISIVEGTVGAFTKTPSVLGIGLEATSEWYDTVSEMEKVGKSELYALPFMLTVTVEDLEGNKDTIDIVVPVEGYTMVLGREW
ncbi:MAG: hypothetical protein Q7K42_05895, partial [Candidatus Diapherotrites archaeon]|nr:hypothetical protein [Candidatus Diapherotrites archaeon]